MKRPAFIIVTVAVALLWCPKNGFVSGEGVAPNENNDEEEEIGPCGPVPNHGQMMAVLKPMSHIVVCSVNKIMDYGILLKDIQRVIERLCVVFDGCVPTGKLANIV